MTCSSDPAHSLRRRDWLRWPAAGAAASLLLPRAAWSQGRGALEGGALRIVVPYAPGGSSDSAARLLAEAMEPRLGVPVAVDNRPGAGGRLAVQQLHREKSGQNVALLANPATMLIAPLVFKDNGYEPDRDYVPLSQVTRYAFGVAVGTGAPVRGFSQLHAWMVAHRHRLSAGVPATGSLPHFFALMLAEKAGVKAQVVGYRGSGPLMTDLIGGQVPVAFDTFETLLPQHEGRKLRVLASSGAKRSRYAPDVPTFRESGLDLVATGWNAFFAPASMPAAKVAQYAAAIRDVMRDPDTQRRFAAAKMTPVVSTQAETRAMLEKYRAQWAPVVQKSGYTP